MKIDYNDEEFFEEGLPDDFDDGCYDCICDDCGDQHSIDTYPCPVCNSIHSHNIFHIGEYYDE
jgi:hypothetical protein